MNNVNVLYSGHEQNYGDIGPVKNGVQLGTVGQTLRLEGLKIWLETAMKLGVGYGGHVENIGWQQGVKDGELCGTTGQSLRLEAVKIWLTGDDAENKSIQYQVHVAEIGWMNWVKDGEETGSEGYCAAIEAIRIVVTDKGIDLNTDTTEKFVKYVAPAPQAQAAPEEQPAPTGRLGLRYFDEDNEFKCKCGCGLDVKDEVKIMADNARDEYGFPLVVSSGARCAYQNEIDGGIPNSNHTKGEAVDLYAPGRMSYDEVDNLANVMANNGFGVILYHENLFVHGDEDGEYWSMN